MAKKEGRAKKQPPKNQDSSKGQKKTNDTNGVNQGSKKKGIPKSSNSTQSSNRSQQQPKSQKQQKAKGKASSSSLCNIFLGVISLSIIVAGVAVCSSKDAQVAAGNLYNDQIEPVVMKIRNIVFELLESTASNAPPASDKSAEAREEPNRQERDMNANEEHQRREEEAEKKAEQERKENEKKAEEERKRKEKEEADRKAEQERKEKKEAEERKKKEEAERKAEQERKEKEKKEAEEKARKEKEEAERKAKQERRQKEKKEAEERKRNEEEEAERKAEQERKEKEKKEAEERKRKEKEEAERKAEQERKEKEKKEVEERKRKEKEVAERKAEQERKEKEKKEAEEKKRQEKEEEERKKMEKDEAERKEAKEKKEAEEKKRREKEEAERKTEQERKEKEKKEAEERERREREEAERKAEQEKKEAEEKKRKEKEEAERKAEREEKIAKEKKRREMEESARYAQHETKQKEKDMEKKKLKLDEPYALDSITNLNDYKIKDELDEADRLYEEEDYEGAVRMYDQILKHSHLSPRAMYGKGLTLDKLGFKHMSNEYLEQAINFLGRLLLLPDVPDELFLMAGRTLAEREHFRGWGSKAVKTFTLMLERFPENVKLRCELGVTYMLIGRLAQAEDVFEQVLQLDPNSGFAKAHLGFIFKTRDNNLDKSIPLLKEGILSGEDGTVDGRFYVQLGDALLRKGLEVEARDFFKEAEDKGLFLSQWQRSLYNVKELTGRPFWTPKELGYEKYIELLEKNWEIIRDEGLAQLDEETGSFVPEDENLRDTGDWKQFTLYQQGRKNQDNCKKAPKTCAIIDQIPPAKGCRRGQVKFSVMSPGIHVWPHTGPTNCRLRSHLGLVVPEGPVIRVVNETRSWIEGKVMTFDDSFEHEVWHEGTQYRLILIVDFWHPELTERQQRTLSTI